MIKAVFATVAVFVSMIFVPIDVDGAGTDYISQFGSSGTGNSQFDLPQGIALDSSGNIYVADTVNDRVQIFDSTGTFLSTFGIFGSANGQFTSPIGIALDSSGNIYVVDSVNARVQIFDSTGTFLSTFGSEGTANGQFNSPTGIALDSSGNIYVSDTLNARVQIFDSLGNFLSTFGTFGSANGQFDFLIGIALDSSGNIYVADTFNDRVQIFDSSGTFLSTFGIFGSANGQFNSPTGIALDSSGNIYVVDSLNARVQIFDSSGNFLSTFGSEGTANGQFDSPTGIALDSFGNIYVSDTFNDRVQKFSPFPAISIPVITEPQDGATITTSTVTLTGTAEANATIEVFDGITSLGTATADSNGDWTFTTTTLTDGAHSFTATASNGQNTSNPTDAVNITINTTGLTFTAWTQAVIDLRATKSQAFQDTFPIGTAPEINRLLAWAGNPVAQANNPELQQFGHLYSIMKRWNERTDLQNVFPGADLAADPVNLVIWSGRANVLANSFNSDLVPHEPTYVLLRIFFLERDDLRDNPVFAGALDASDPKRLYCFAANSSDVRLTPHTAFYAANCVL